MFGFIFGAICLYGLIRMLRGPRWGHHHGWRHHHGCSHHEQGFRRSRRGRFWLRGLFERLETSPGQEREITEAVDEVVAAAEAMRDAMFDSRSDIAKAFGEDDLDEEALGTMLSQQDERLDALRKSYVSALSRVHAVLDPDQRRQLARWLSRRGADFGGPYRGAWA